MKVRSKRSAAAEQRRREMEKQRAAGRLRLAMFGAAAAVVAIVVLIVAGGVLRGGSNNSTVNRTAPAAGFIEGSADAPVLITAWEDFQCPVCKAANSSVLKQIEENYVNTGKARLEFKQFPFLGNESYTAAQASQCAADQDKFWPYHDALFAAQGAENSGTFSVTKLTSLAANVGIDTSQFSACLTNGDYKASVQAEKQEGVDLGVKATPTFFVNGAQVADWRDYNAFAAMIEAALQSGS